MDDTDYSQPEAMAGRNSEESGSARAALRLRLSIAIKRAIEARGLTQVDAAFMARTPPTSLTAIVNGNLERVSMDRLVTIAHRLGVGISLRLTTPIQSNPLKS